jgi:hypothetical protein
METQHDNHINNENQRAEGEESSRNRRAEEPAADPNNIYLDTESTLQTPAEFEQDKHGNHPDNITISSTDDHESNSGGAAGTDRAGTAERKDYGEPKLNQGIEEQGGQKTYE